MLLCNSGLFLPSLSISGGSIDYNEVTIHRPSVILWTVLVFWHV